MADAVPALRQISAAAAACPAAAAAVTRTNYYPERGRGRRASGPGSSRSIRLATNTAAIKIAIAKMIASETTTTAATLIQQRLRGLAPAAYK
jgi:hypothetical protein